MDAAPVEGLYTSLAVSWDAPPDTVGAPPLIGYEVRYRERPDGDWVDCAACRHGEDGDARRA